MADPISLAAIGSAVASTAASAAPYVALAGAGVSALGAYQSGQAQKAANDYNSQVENIRASEATQASQAQAQIVQQQTTEKLGQAAAAYGAAGVDTAGSPLTLMSSLAMKGELNRRLTLYQGSTKANEDTQQSALDSLQATQAATAGDIRAGGSLLTGVAQFAGPNGPLAAGKSLVNS